MDGMKLRQSAFGNVWDFTADNPCEFLAERFKTYPAGALLFHDGRDVTPKTAADVDALERLSGDFTLMAVPQGPVAPYLIATAISLAIGFILRPSIEAVEPPDPGRSPTNALTRGRNRQRVGGRVPDIYGSVYHTPDLLAPIFERFEYGSKVEYMLLCVGRGTFGSSMTIYDGGVNISGISGYSAKVFEPGDALDDTPAQSIGDDFDLDTMTWQKIESAEYQNIPPNNEHSLTSTGAGSTSYLWARNPSDVDEDNGHITSTNQTDEDMTYDLSAQFPEGSVLEILDSYAYGVGTPLWAGIEGQYIVTKSTREQLWLEIPDAKASAWAGIDTGDNTDHGMIIEQSSPLLVFADIPATRKVVVNFEAPRGLYYSTVEDPVEIELDVTSTWAMVDSPYSETDQDVTGVILSGSSPHRTGISVELTNPFGDDRECEVQISIQRQDGYRPGSPTSWSTDSISTCDLASIYAERGDDSDTVTTGVTTILTRLATTYQSRQLRDRTVTAEVARKLDGSETRLFTDALEDMALDTYIGRLTSGEIDTTAWNLVAAAINTYFSSDPQATYFDHVFDNVNLSFEDMVASVAERCFCTAYRQGNVLQIRSELPTDTRTLLFTHRNKIPGTETRTIRFGNENDYTGVTQAYSDPNHKDEKVNYEVGSMTNPAKSGVIGIRDATMAEVHAKRKWNRIQLVNEVVQFEATQEAGLLVPGDIILVADGTRTDVQDGDLVDLVTTADIVLNREVTLESGVDYIIWLQHDDGTTEAYTVGTTGPATTDELELDPGPSEIFQVDPENYARTTFLLVPDTEEDANAFRVLEVMPSGKMTYNVTAERYDENVYADD